MSSHAVETTHSCAQTGSAAIVRRSFVIGLIAFLTVVDLFAAQAILPMLTRAYGVTPAAMGFAVNASTLGMVIAGLTVAFFSRRIERRSGILLSLALLSIPTMLLAWAPNLTAFTLLRVAQGLCMASAFTLTLAHLGEQFSAREAGSAFAAYITGNVASNLVGRLTSAGIADHFGLAANFYFFAVLNVAGAMLAYFALQKGAPMPGAGPSMGSRVDAWLKHLRNVPLRSSFGIGFCILFAFIGTFTYVNFVLVREPLSLGQMTLGLVYFVFLPSILTTPFGGRAVERFGTRLTLWTSLAFAGAGLPLLLLANLSAVLVGLAMVGAGTFFAQAATTGFVSKAATDDRGSASGIYLASYFFGGLIGSAILGQLFDRIGWSACVAGIAFVLGLAMLLTFSLVGPHTRAHRSIQQPSNTIRSQHPPGEETQVPSPEGTKDLHPCG